MERADANRRLPGHCYACHRVALNDFSRADAFAALLIKRKWFGPVHVGVSTPDVQQLALCTAFVVTYARPFSDNDRWKFRLKGCGLDTAQRDLHSRLVALRNEVFAHSDATTQLARGVRPDQTSEAQWCVLLQEPTSLPTSCRLASSDNWQRDGDGEGAGSHSVRLASRADENSPLL